MKNSVFLNFLTLILYKDKKRHIAIFIVSTICIFMLLSIIFIKESLQNELLNSLKNQSDFVVQKKFSNRDFDIDISLIDKIKRIDGIKDAKQRVYGLYHFLSEDRYFTIVGIDFFEKNSEIEELLLNFDIKEFLEQNSMIVANGVKKTLDKYQHFDSYDFELYNKQKTKVKIYEYLPKELNLFANDLIIMDINLAKEILNIDKNFTSDILVDVSNEIEKDNIKQKLLRLDNNLNIVDKDILKKRYEEIFNYKGGVFLILFIVVLSTFMLILYQKYSQINSNQKKEVAILKALGFSIADIIKLKLCENFIVAMLAFVFGLFFAYIFVFILNAPILKNIFIGFSNIENDFIINFYIDISSIITIFLFFIIPFLSSVLIPVYKIATINPYESLK